MEKSLSWKKILSAIILVLFTMLCGVLFVGCSDGKDGKDGADGADGARWITGIDAPTSAIGVNGDMYLDMDDYVLYQKVSGNWVIIMRNFGKGENGKDGVDGVDGVDGTNGLDGATWLYGEGLPLETNGVAGDLYLDAASYDVYFRTSDGWGSPIANIKGETGANGLDGETPTLSFNEDGYLEINNIATDVKKVVVDANLESAGAAADAAVVGEKLEEILNLINTSSVDVERLSSYVDTVIYDKVNLITEDVTWLEGYYISAASGVASLYYLGLEASPYYCVNTYIPVEPEKNYVLFQNNGDTQSAVNLVHIAFYDMNKTYISGTTSEMKIISTPEGAAYVRFTINKNSGSNPSYENVAGNMISVEFYNQNTTVYSKPTAILSLQGIDASETLIDGSVTVELCDFFDVYDSPNLIVPDSIVEGYYCVDTTGRYQVNEAYVVYPFIPVTPGKILNVYTPSGTVIPMRFVTCYDSSYTVMSSVGSSSSPTKFTIPENCYYVAVTISTSYTSKYDLQIQCTSDGAYLGKYYEPGVKIYKLNSEYYEAITTTTPYAYLPSELCVAEGVTVELYNEQICINVDNWHVQWITSGKFGTVTERKISITCTEALVGTTGTLTFNLYDDNLLLVYTTSCSVKFVSAELATDQLLIPIGDSLTNNKAWLSKIYQTLSNGKIKFRGTQGTTDATLDNGITHEGRSGAGTGWYNSGASTYTFNPTNTTLEVQSTEDGTQYTTNPFWNPTTDEFDFDYYCNSTADGGAGYFEDADGNEISITPTGIVIFLGANGMSLDSTTAVTNISTLITNIQKSNKGANLPIYVVNTLFRPTQIFSETADGYSTNSAGEFSYRADMKVLNLEIGLYNKLSTTNNVYFVPVASTLDRVYSFPFEYVSANPYVDTITEIRYTDCVHPSTAGYYQIADILFSTIAAHYADVSA